MLSIKIPIVFLYLTIKLLITNEYSLILFINTCTKLHDFHTKTRDYCFLTRIPGQSYIFKYANDELLSHDLHENIMFY